MVDNFWGQFWLSLAFTLFLTSIIVWGVICFIKYKWFQISMILGVFFASIFTMFMARSFVNCCRDFSYVINHTYIEEKAIIEDITITKGRFGEEVNRGAKVRLLDSNEYIYFDIEVINWYRLTS